MKMAINLSAKERMLLQDQKSHEELCVQKYQNYSNQAQDPQLKQLFSSLAKKEQEHLNSINQILNGQVPNVQQQSGSQNQQGQQWGSQNQQGQQSGSQNQQNKMQGTANLNDSTLCSDMLVTEKYISGAYNTAIFEFEDTNVRQVLNHIQKEEQEHGNKFSTI
jgi:spore coat protein CotF